MNEQFLNNKREKRPNREGWETAALQELWGHFRVARTAPSKIRGAGECPCVWPLPPRQGSRGSIVCFVICAGLHADSQTHRPEHISAQNKAGSTECHNTNLASLSGAAPALQAISTCLAPTGLSKQPHTHSLHTSLLHKVALSRLEEIAILSNSYKQI